ncbi:MAG: glycine cleavage system aminomethyltransferase GcvT [Nitrososphaeraceae archaeon]
MKTPFYDFHVRSGAKMVNFHGWNMPLQYSGIIEEHVNTRHNVSLFDVSHMGRFEVQGDDASDLLQMLLTNDVSKLDNNQAMYSPLCNCDGGIVDDVIIYRINNEKFLLVVNASNRTKDFLWVSSHSKSSIIRDISDTTALVALQGPRAIDVLESALPLVKLASLKPFSFMRENILDFGQEGLDKIETEKRREETQGKQEDEKSELVISRTGYTGEDGFELFFDSSRIDIWEKLMRIGTAFNIKPAGLGARDTLRLEAGFMLYGSDMDETTTPMEVPLRWTVKLEKPAFIGKQALMTRPITRKLLGFEVFERRIARHGNTILIDGQPSGYVTSGNYSPTLKKSIGFCLVTPKVSPGQVIEIDIGGKKYKATISSSTRFYKRK